MKKRGQFDRTALHAACQEGHTACIPVWVRHGTNIKARESEHDEETPIHLAAFFNRVNCVKVLIGNYGASINSRDKFNQTPLRDGAVAERF